jgi:gluconate 2-dehydrogenase alpha chain
MAHVTPFAFGRFPGRRLNTWNGTWSQATCVDDWNADNFDHTGNGFIGGGLLVASHESKPIAFARSPVPPGVPRWGSRWKAWLAANAQSVGSASGQMECLPYEDTRLDLDPERRDPYGEPVVRVTHRVHQNEERGAAFLAGRLEDWLRAAGADEVWHGPRFVEARHCYGGARMGDDPATSVVDRDCFVHDAPNLGVLGTSVYPSSGGHNPTLTLQALAWRAAERLAARL